ncbi:hypothetical protein [Agromyces archimandritae]|uniref:PH domain-containing protein n=1 Tax=Agromyces archimandritae TaxID=2781962 RepID=A0A975FK64_9MICO|nr:hypothetical protein [Agromyces archimandritae]QTX03479.1 hypothetical protein G127AT_08905 [Agromyces archimandritae]
MGTPVAREAATFSEELRGPPWLRILGILSGLMVVTATPVFWWGIVETWGSPSSVNLLLGFSVFVLAVGGAAVMGICNSTRVLVRGRRLYGFVTPLRVMNVDLGAVRSSEHTTTSPAAAGGIGYRWTPGGGVLLLDAGSAIDLVLLDGKRYTVRSDRPEELSAAIASSR